MGNALHISMRLFAGIAGALLVYVALFLHDDEEARLQNRLEQAWKRIYAAQSTAVSREAAFLQEVSRTTSAILDRLLGRRLLSPQSVAVSMAISVASLSLVIGFGGYGLSMEDRAAQVLFAALLLNTA